MKKTFVLLMALLALASSGCAAKTPVVVQAPDLPTPVAVPEPTVAQAQEPDFSMTAFNDFAVRLFAASVEDGNVLQMPLMQVLCLAQLRPGASAETAAEMDAMLGLPDGLTQDDFWSDFSALWQSVQNVSPGQLTCAFDLVLGEGPSVHTRYISFLKQALDTDLMMVDYESAKFEASFHDWIKEKTHGVITQMTNIPTENTNTVLMSTALYRVQWKRAFNTENVIKTTFRLDNGQKLSVPMMTARTGPAVLTDQGTTFVCLPLDEEMEAWMILPSGDSNSTELIESLTAEKILQWRADAQTTNCLVSIPRLEMTSTGSLFAAFKNMGMTYMDNAEQADYSGMGDKITLSEVLYANKLTVDESGKEECEEAMTQRMLRGMDKTYSLISFNRPFVLILADKSTRTIVMMARVANPTNKVVNIYQ